MTNNAINTDIPIEVSNGGTGAASLTDHGVLLGSGTSPITVTSVGTTNTVIQGSTGADPSFTATPQVTSIDFGSTALDYYDEGTWTPVLTFGGASTGITYTAQVGTYTRIGNVVFCFMNMTLSSKGSAAGNAQISGLPFTVGDQGAQAVPFRQQYITFTATYYVVTLQAVAADTYMIVSEMGSNSGGLPLPDTSFANNSALVVDFWYHTT